MDETLKVSAAGAVVRKTRLIQLPAREDGTRLVLRVGAVGKLAIITTLEGIPGIGGGKVEGGWEVKKETIKASVKPEARLAEMGIVEPAFSFGEEREAGFAWWDDLSMDEQAYVIAQIMEVSDWKGAKPAGADGFSGGAAG